ncbi:MAG TPA: RluA family pseudouridine synthase [Candidatus Coproplasma stercorigallinarum]|nr:RluA family pseudouridine synthase [Candidatus Coproplasma stercorigallinarum]
MKKFICTRATDLQSFTDETYPQGSFAFAALLRARDIKVNGVRTGKNVPLCDGDEVVYYTTPAQEAKPSHAVVYEDENIIVCDKFSGVSAEGLLSELCVLGSAFAVHRLDRNTEGLIVYAKSERAAAELVRAFKERRVKKVYLALCRNNFTKKQACLTAYLKKDSKKASVTVSDTPRKGFVKIVTEYRVVKEEGDAALAEITLHTGKTHQIRAHMAHIGCPIVGDEKYGDNALNKKYGARRQRLVAKQLSFELSGELSYLSSKTFTSSFTPQ